MILFVLSLLFAASMAAGKQSADEYFKLCSRNDPLLDDCMRQSIMAAMPKLAAGIPALSLPSMDPLFIPKMELQESNGNFKFRLTLRDVKADGLKDLEVNRVMSDLSKADNMTITLLMKIPRMFFKGQYEMAGQVLVIPLKGDGDFYFNFTDVNATAVLKGHTIKQNGDQEHLEVRTMEWNFKVGGGESYFSNLFNGDKQLGSATNRILNQNFRDIFKTYINLPEEAFGELFKEFSNKVWKRFPLRELITS